MKIHLEAKARCGDVVLPAGDLVIEVDEEQEVVVFHTPDGPLRLPAFRRSSKMRVHKPAAQVRPVEGEKRSLLVVRTPPATEWVVSLDEA